jgi:hemerythrin superfamily protein
MNATDVLRAQHRTIDALFDDVATERQPDARAHALSRLSEELIAHMASEEAVFYPAVERMLGLASVIAESHDEHLLVRAQLRRVLATEPGDAAIDTKIDVLRQLVQKHQGEEEGDLFVRVERALTGAELEVLGEEILNSRPPVWIVTTDAKPPSQRGWRGRVTLAIPPTRE